MLTFAFMLPFLLFTTTNGLMQDQYRFTSVDVLSDETYASYVNSTFVRSVYFYKKAHNQLNLLSFFKEYDGAAAHLRDKKVSLGAIDCDVFHSVAPCGEKNIGEDVYVFKKGKELVKLGLETMFDLDSIVANLLQLLMLREVLILQTVADRENLLEENVGKRNILFSYQKAMGTYEHRVFLESAFAYGEDYTFAITTEMDGIQGLSDSDSADIKKNAYMWIIKCKDVVEGKTCPDTKYNGVMDITNLARYLKLLKNPIRFDIPGDGDVAVYESQEIHMAFLMYDEHSKEEVIETAQKLGDQYFGTIGVVTIDVTVVNTEDRFDHNRDAYKPPVFAIKLYGKKPLYMINKFSLENILKFVKAQLLVAEKEAYKMRLEAMPDAPLLPSSTDNGEFDDHVQTPDDEVAESVRRLQKPKTEIDLSKIPALTDKTFPDVKTKNQITLVLFYVKFDPISMAFLRSYSDAATTFTEGLVVNPLARIDCFDWTDVCGKQNITKFPTINIYKKDKDPVEYKGLLDGERVISYLRVHQVENPMQLTTKDQAMSFIAGSYPENSIDYCDVMVIAGLTGREQELTVLQEVANEFQGEFLFAYGVDSVAKDICSKFNAKLPCVVIIKHNDPFHPSKVFSGAMEPQELKDFVRKNRLPIFTELTVENFPIFYQQKKPLVLFFGDEAGNPEQFKALSDVAVGGVVTDRLFAWVDVSNVDSIGTRILQTYSTDAQIPTIAGVNLARGFVHLYQGEKFESNLIIDWIRDVEEKKEWPEYIMPESRWPPLQPGYDFLDLMKKDSNRDVVDDEYLAIANENGIGFDADGNPIDRKSIDELGEEADELVGAVPSSRLVRGTKLKKEKHRNEHDGHEQKEGGDEHTPDMDGVDPGHLGDAHVGVEDGMSPLSTNDDMEHMNEHMEQEHDNFGPPRGHKDRHRSVSDEEVKDEGGQNKDIKDHDEL